MGPKEQVHKDAFEFLTRHARAKTTFTFAELEAVTKWQRKSWSTYLSKQFRDYVERRGKDAFFVRPTFLDLEYEQYRGLSTQRRAPVTTRWHRRTYDQIVVYEFLLPLTREDKLRVALDNLFYVEALDSRMRALTTEELKSLAEVMPRLAAEDDDPYGARVIGKVADLIGGYSISHVSGRFRVADTVVSRGRAAQMLVNQERYLIDETTAVVRFIVRCPNSKSDHGDAFDHRKRGLETRLEEDVHLIRTLFFLFFVEAVARTILQGEEEVIWLIEHSPEGERLYAWEKAAHGGTQDVQEDDDDDESGEGDDVAHEGEDEGERA